MEVSRAGFLQAQHCENPCKDSSHVPRGTGLIQEMSFVNSGIRFRAGQVCRWSERQRFELDGAPVYIVGVNYVARYVCTNFWEDWRPEVLAADLDHIAAVGLNAVRIPINWEYAEPRPGTFRPEMIERLGVFLKMAEEHGLFVMPWCLVGVATLTYDVSYRNGGSFFREPMLTYAAEHMRRLVHLFKDRPNILCWDICDEPEYYSSLPGADPLPYPAGLVEAWVARIAATIRDEDPNHTVTLGFGHIAHGNFGMNVREMAELLDVMCITAYPQWGRRELLPRLRNSYNLGWNLRMNDLVGRGVFTAETPGWSDVAAGERMIAGYYRQALHSSLANGSMGIMPWVWNDFDKPLHHIAPIETAPLETSFGISRADGSLKPAGEELAGFARWLQEVDIFQWTPLRTEAAIVVPECYTARVNSMQEVMFNAYVLARQAGLHVCYVWERDLATLDEGARLFIVPAVEGYRTSTWYTLAERVHQGGGLWCSYGGTGQMAYPWRNLFGVEALGTELTAGSRLPLPGAEESVLAVAGGTARLVLQTESAEVISQSADQAYSLTRNRHGRGQAFLLNYPLEAEMTDLAVGEMEAFHGFLLYRWAAVQAGLQPTAMADDPRAEVACYEQGARVLVVFVNHSLSSLNTELTLTFPCRIESSKFPAEARTSGAATHVDVQLEPAEAGAIILVRE